MYCTAWEVSKCGDFSCPYFSVLSPNTEKYRPENMPYLGTFHAVIGKDMFFVYSKHLWCGKILQNWRSVLLKLFQVKITHRYFNNAEAVSKDLLNLPYILQKNMVNTTTQLHSTKPELRFCAGSNPAYDVLEIRDGENLWQWSRLEIILCAFCLSTMPQKQFIIIIISIIIIIIIIIISLF